MNRCVSLLGLPWDRSSSHARGASVAPHLVLGLLHSDAFNPYSLALTSVHDAVAQEQVLALPSDGEGARACIEAEVQNILQRGFKPLSIGGDHSVTQPVLRALRAHHGPVNVLHIDAHPDLYDELDGDPYSHACPFARALDEGSIGQLVQVGIRASTPQQKRKAGEHGVLQLGAEAWADVPQHLLDGPLYVSIDLDGLDPSCAPGVSHPEPGGLSSRDLLRLLARIRGPLLGADVVELNPERDIGLLTAGVAVRLIKELAHLASRDVPNA